MRYTLLIVLMSIILYTSTASASIISYNNGGSHNAAMSPNRVIEGFFIGQGIIIATAPQPALNGSLPKDDGRPYKYYLLIFILICALAVGIIAADEQRKKRRRNKNLRNSPKP